MAHLLVDRLRDLAAKYRRFTGYPRAYEKALLQLRREHANDPGVVLLAESFYPPFHSYMEHHGPWLEHVVQERWLRGGYAEDPDKANNWTFVGVPWTDLRVHRGPNGTFADLETELAKHLQPGRRYFTVLNHFQGSPVPLPDHLQVFSGGGIGHIPVPLLKDQLPYYDGPRDILCSFMGRGLDEAQHGCDVRQRMYAALHNEQDIILDPSQGVVAFHNQLNRSIFSLCPRGSGPTSYRLYESLHVGSIPIYIWDQTLWLPYADELDWSEIAIVMHIDEIDTLAATLRDIAADPDRVARMRARGQELVPHWFTMTAAADRIIERQTRH